jgi:ferredoxin
MKLFVIDGDAVSEFAGEPGERLLDACQRAGLPLEGTCGGDMACATCHVVVRASDFDRLPPASEEEEDMLDLVPNARRTSRLACQIVLTPVLEGLGLSFPTA